MNLNTANTGGLEVTTGAGSNVTGQTYGINALNRGTGALAITANGEVTGNTYDGILAFNTNPANTGGLEVTTGADSIITGQRYGIVARNYGTGALAVTANGEVTGNTFSGIFARNSNAANMAGLEVTTGADSNIFGYNYGINAYNFGTGALAVTANGEVTANTRHGILAWNSNLANSAGMEVTTGADSVITGERDGIVARNDGIGALAVTANGEVTGNTYDGIYARNTNAANAGGLEVTTGTDSDVTGERNGINAYNFGTGALAITANGEVASNTRVGIFARNANTGNTGGLEVTTGADSVITGERFGIYARNAGTGALAVTANGEVTGGSAGIFAQTDGSSISITVGGSVQSMDGSAGSVAIQSVGGETTLDNGGIITGRVLLGDLDDTFTNADSCNTAGDSDFGGGSDEVRNDGRIKAGGTEDVADTTNFLNLERLRNGGTISMIDQASRDGSNISDSLELSGDYEGEGGVLGVDAFLGGPGSLADVFTIRGNSSGTTYVAVNETQSGFAALNPDGILLAVVEGSSAASDFAMLGGYYSSGLYSYDVVYDGTGPDGRFLLKGFAGLHSFEVAAIVSGAQNIFFDTAAGWVERQNDLRDWHGRRTAVVAVADPPVAEDVNETGLWLTIRGTATDREASADWDALGNRYEFDTGYEQTTFSVLGGADFGTSLGSGTLLFGALAGYFSSAQDLNSSDTEIDYEGGSLGAYASYLNSGFFLALLGKADIYGIDYEAAGPGGDSTTGTNLGLRADAGYRFTMGSAYLEPVASLAAVWTDIDDFALYNTTAEPGSNDAVQLGGGARLGWETASLDLSLTGRVWEVVSDGNDVGLTVPGTALDEVTDPSFTGAFGEVSGRLGYRIGNRATAHLAGSYLFNDDQTTLTGAAGLSYSW